MENNDKITVYKNKEGGCSGFVKIESTAEEFLINVGPMFLLDKDNINYIIKKTPEVSSDRWRNLVASMALFIRCPKSKVPPVSIDFLVTMLWKKGYYILEKDILRGMHYLRKLKLYPSFCQLDELKLLETYRTYIYKGLEFLPSEKADIVFKQTKEILIKSKEKEVAINLSPVLRIFAALYISSILNIRQEQHVRILTQKKVAQMGGTNPIPIRNAYKEIAEGLNIELIL